MARGPTLLPPGLALPSLEQEPQGLGFRGRSPVHRASFEAAGKLFANEGRAGPGLSSLLQETVVPVGILRVCGLWVCFSLRVWGEELHEAGWASALGLRGPRQGWLQGGARGGPGSCSGIQTRSGPGCPGQQAAP